MLKCKMDIEMNDKKGGLNSKIQSFLFPGIGTFGLLICFLLRRIDVMPVFYSVSLISRAIFSFCGRIYGKGLLGEKEHWYSKKECILDGVIHIILFIIGAIEIALYFEEKKFE